MDDRDHLEQASGQDLRTSEEHHTDESPFRALPNEAVDLLRKEGNETTH